MRNTIKLGLTALIAAMLLASALSTASARNLEVTSATNFRTTWSRLEFQSSLVTVRCQVTLEGSFHSRTIPKIAGLLIGSITRINVKENSCTGGEARPDRPPPWHLTYEGFTGRLPNIEAIRLLMQRFQFEIIAIGVTCKYGTSTDNVTGEAFRNATNEITNIQPTVTRNIAHLLEGPGLCPGTGTLVGGLTDGTTTVLDGTARVRIRLI